MTTSRRISRFDGRVAFAEKKPCGRHAQRGRDAAQSLLTWLECPLLVSRDLSVVASHELREVALGELTVGPRLLQTTAELGRVGHVA